MISLTIYTCVGPSPEAAVVASILNASGASADAVHGGGIDGTVDLAGLPQDAQIVLVLRDHQDVPAALASGATPFTVARYADLVRTPLAATAALLTRLQDPDLRLPSSTQLDELIASALDRQGSLVPESTASTAKRAAIVVLGCRLEAFAPILAAMRSTWGSVHNDNLDIYYAYGNAGAGYALADAGVPNDWVPEGEVREHHDLLLVGAADLIHHQSDAILRKRLLSLQHLLAEHDHDAFLLLCASSYIDQDEFSTFLQNVDLTTAFHGIPNATDHDEPFLSGSCMLFSRDLAEELVSNADAVIAAGDYQYADDVTIARWIAENISHQQPHEIMDRLFAHPAQLPGPDNTFQSFPASFQDFTIPPTDRSPNEQHQPVDGCFHYHFATARPAEMRAFHHRMTKRETAEPVVAEQHLRFVLDLDTSAIERRPDYDIWVFAMFDQAGNELWRNDITDPDVLAFRSTTVHVDGVFPATPTSYLLWPRTPDGFSNRIVLPLEPSRTRASSH